MVRVITSVITEDKDGANKKYVNDEIKAIPAVDTSDLLKLDIMVRVITSVITEDKDGANKKYVNDEIKAIPAVDTSDLLKLDGSRAMTGNLQMGDHTITGIRSSSQDNAALTVGASKSFYLPISGIRGMQGNLNMGGQSIVNLRPFVEIDSAQPAQDNEVFNLGYFYTQRGD